MVGRRVHYLSAELAPVHYIGGEMCNIHIIYACIIVLRRRMVPLLHFSTRKAKWSSYITLYLYLMLAVERRFPVLCAILSALVFFFKPGMRTLPLFSQVSTAPRLLPSGYSVLTISDQPLPVPVSAQAKHWSLRIVLLETNIPG